MSDETTTTTDASSHDDIVVTRPFTTNPTPYEVIKAVNIVRRELQMKDLPSQMGYNYAKNVWKRDVTTSSSDGKIRINNKRANDWYVKYVTNLYTPTDS